MNFSPYTIAYTISSWIIHSTHALINQIIKLSIIKETLTSCWKDRQVDETRSLELLRVLVDRQADIFAAIGVEFPKWDNRPLSIKDIAHCLAQYSKYLEIQKDLSRQ